MLKFGEAAVAYQSFTRGSVRSRVGARGHDSHVDAALAVARATLRVAIDSELMLASDADAIYSRYSEILKEAKSLRVAPDILAELRVASDFEADMQAMAWRLADSMVPTVPFCVFAGRLRATSEAWLTSQPECGTLLTYLGGKLLVVDSESRSLMIGHINPVAAVVLRDMIGKLIRSLRGQSPIISAVAIPIESLVDLSLEPPAPES